MSSSGGVVGVAPVRFGLVGYGFGGRYFHAPLIASAVGCELTAADARAAVELAERLGVVLSVYQNRRWDSDFRTVRALAGGGALGEITRFESRFERRQDGPPAAGGGTLLDFGSHLVDQALQLLGPVRTVYAEIRARDDAVGLDDDVFIALTHAGGARSHLWGSWVQSAPGPRFRVTGTRATYVVDGMDIQEELLLAGRTPASEGDAWGVEPQDRWGRVHDGSAAVPQPTERGRWDTYHPAFAAAVRGGGPVPVDPRDAVATAEVLDAARASDARRELVVVTG